MQKWLKRGVFHLTRQRRLRHLRVVANDVASAPLLVGVHDHSRYAKPRVVRRAPRLLRIKGQLQVAPVVLVAVGDAGEARKRWARRRRRHNLGAGAEGPLLLPVGEAEAEESARAAAYDAAQHRAGCTGSHAGRSMMATAVGTASTSTPLLDAAGRRRLLALAAGVQVAETGPESGVVAAGGRACHAAPRASVRR